MLGSIGCSIGNLYKVLATRVGKYNLYTYVLCIQDYKDNLANLDKIK